jgi:hypothetical protein
MPLKAIIRARHLLSDAEIERMYALQNRYFTRVCRERFRRDLSEKDWVILQEHPQCGLAGFSTASCFRVQVGEGDVHVLFSGDTVIDRDAWQSSTLAGAFGHLALRIEEQSSSPLYWLLISKGYRTYRFLPVFFNEFYPVHDRPTPARYMRLLDRVCTVRFGDAWQPHAGVLDFGEEHERLRRSMCTIPSHRASDLHVRHFLARNPDFMHGIELACIAPVRRANFNRAGLRAMAMTEVVWDE